MANLNKITTKKTPKQQAHDWMQRAAALHSRAASSSARRSDCLNGNTNYGSRLWRTEWTIKSAGRSTDSRGLPHIWQLLSPFGGGREGRQEEEEEEKKKRRKRNKKKKKKNDTEVQPGRSGFQQITGCLCEAVKETARRSLIPGTKTWLLTVKERIEEKNVPSSYLESFERTPSKTAANCRQRGRDATTAQAKMLETFLQ